MPFAFVDPQTFTANGQSRGVVQATDQYAGTVTYQLTGTFTATIEWQGTIDGTNFVAIQATNLNSGTAATTATAAGLYRIDATGLRLVRGTTTAYTSGTATLSAAAAIG